eukprot:6461762-Amphidinium_carterae.2
MTAQCCPSCWPQQLHEDGPVVELFTVTGRVTSMLRQHGVHALAISSRVSPNAQDFESTIALSRTRHLALVQASVGSRPKRSRLPPLLPGYTELVQISASNSPAVDSKNCLLREFHFVPTGARLLNGGARQLGASCPTQASSCSGLVSTENERIF